MLIPIHLRVWRRLWAGKMAPRPLFYRPFSYQKVNTLPTLPWPLLALHLPMVFNLIWNMNGSP